MNRPFLRLSIVAAASAFVLVVVGGLVISLLAPVELVIGNIIVFSQRDMWYPVPPSASEMSAGSTALATNVVREVDLAGPQARNLVLVIGDGLGVGGTSTASALLHGVRGGLAVEDMATVGLVRTWPIGNLVTDSAASGTAIATGFKTNNRRVSMLPDGRKPVTLLEAARRQGLAAGVVTTTALFDATPACFTTHSSSRKQHGEILSSMLDSGLEVMLGGDWGLMREAEKDLETAALVRKFEDLEGAGYDVVRSADELAAARGERLVGLFPERSNLEDAHGPPLEQSVAKALEVLSADPEGFVLVVESEIPDESAHTTDVKSLVAGVAEMDAAVRLILAFAETRSETLVVVTADHDTGALSLARKPKREGHGAIRWSSDRHTSQWVPLFAQGPGAERFDGVLDNTRVGRELGAILGLDDFPALHDE